VNVTLSQKSIVRLNGRSSFYAQLLFTIWLHCRAAWLGGSVTSHHLTENQLRNSIDATTHLQLRTIYVQSFSSTCSAYDTAQDSPSIGLVADSKFSAILRSE
jgi:hypothetical protein